MTSVRAFQKEMGRLDGHLRLASDNQGDIRAGVAELLCAHELECDDRNGRINAALSLLSIGDINFIKLRYGSNVAVRPAPSSGFVMLQFVLSGHVQVEHDRRLTEGRAGEAIIIESLDQRALRWSADCEQLIVPIRRSTIARAMETLTGRPSPSLYGFDRSFSLDTPEGRSLMALAGYLMSLPPVMGAGNAATSALLADVLAHHLLLHHRSEAIDGFAVAAVPYHVHRAEKFMRANVAANIDLDSIAAHAGVSTRTLSAAFRRFRDASPMEWLRNHRLEQVRTRLLAGEAVTVASAAAQAGFLHAGRFSQLYRDRFGESPNITLAAARRG